MHRCAKLFVLGRTLARDGKTNFSIAFQTPGNVSVSKRTVRQAKALEGVTAHPQQQHRHGSLLFSRRQRWTCGARASWRPGAAATLAHVRWLARAHTTPRRARTAMVDMKNPGFPPSFFSGPPWRSMPAASSPASITRTEASAARFPTAFTCPVRVRCVWTYRDQF